MLVLRRRTGEGIAIGQDIEIEVIEISRTRVKLGIRAPQNVQVCRREADSVAEDNRKASSLLLIQGAGGVTEMAALVRTLSGIQR